MNFCPAVQKTVNLAVTGTSQTLTVGAVPAGRTALLLTNIGTKTVFWRYGSSAATAAASVPIMANTSMIVDFPEGETAISAIAGDTGSTLYATPGIGY